jgi:hypothetical protein
MKHLKHTSETTETLETYTATLYIVIATYATSNETLEYNF